MTDSSAKRHMRWWVPVLVVLVVGLSLVYFFVTQDVARYFLAVALFLIAFVLISLWYIFLTQFPWKKRLRLFAIWVLAVVGVTGGLMATTRWEGSLNGGALPRLVWKWLPNIDERLDPLEGSGGQVSLQPGGAPAVFAQYLGPKRDGVLADVHLDPDWSAHPPEELWRREIGAGWCGFSVADGRAITLEQRGKLELVSCYDLATGEPLWVHQNEARFEEVMGGDGPRSNPTIHEGKVYAMGATGILMCLEESSGSVVWSRNVLEDPKAENVMYGKSTGPLLVGELVIVTGGKAPGPTLLAFDRTSGTPVWTAGEDSASYASPILTTLAGVEQIVSVNQNSVTGHDVTSGEILWSWKWGGKMPKSSQPQPVGGDRIFVSSSYGMGTALLKVAVSGDEFETSIVWKNLQMKTKFSNVGIRDGFAYGLDEGRLACVEVASGKRKWRGTNYGYGQNLLVGEHLLVQSERGYVALVEASPGKFREVGRVKALSAKTWNIPTLAGEYLLVRNDREAVCYKVRLK